MTIVRYVMGLFVLTPLATHAEVIRIVIDTKNSPAPNLSATGPAGPYETIAGRAYGELDSNDQHNAIITDIDLAPRNANGKVEYMATFLLTKPINMAKSSHVMWQDAPNRGDRATFFGDMERSFGDVGLSTGWQGDNTGWTAQTLPNTNEYAVVPIAKNPDGSSITGKVIGRIINASGGES